MNFCEFESGRCYRELQNLNGSRIYEQNGDLFLVIVYDDIQEDEADAFTNASFEVVFKTFGLISLFTFKFRDYIVDAPFNQFSGCLKSGQTGCKEESGIPIVIFIGESSTGELITKREAMLPGEFCAGLEQVLAEQYTEYSKQYNLRTFNEGIREIYDNHVIEEVYHLPGDREISCIIG